MGNLVCVEWQEHVDMLCTAIKWLTKQIDDKCSTLNAKDDSCIELRKAEKNGWAIRFVNLCVLKEQLLCKLRARKAELCRLDRPHGQREVDQNLRAHVKKAVKS